MEEKKKVQQINIELDEMSAAVNMLILL